jgi:hypothetical protein
MKNWFWEQSFLCLIWKRGTPVSRGKTEKGETGKRDYRHRSRIGCV